MVVYCYDNHVGTLDYVARQYVSEDVISVFMDECIKLEGHSGTESIYQNYKIWYDDMLDYVKSDYSTFGITTQ